MTGLAVETTEAIAEYRREESDDGVASRLFPFFEQVWGEAAEIGPVALVSHGGPIRVMLERLGILPDEIWHYRRQFDHQNPLPPAAPGRSPAPLTWIHGKPGSPLRRPRSPSMRPQTVYV